MTVEIRPVRGIGEVAAGDDLAGMIAAAAPDLRDGDVLVVTSKIVSKAEGRVVRAERDTAIDAETVRVVARRDATRIVQTRHGLVMAAAGVDSSNVEKGSVVLLPVDPDASARRLRAGLRAALGADVGVIVSDTAGRPWRNGVTDIAIGVAGVAPMHDLRGSVDPYGNELRVTVVAVADELAAAADLAKGKLDGVPVAVVRGYPADRAEAGGARDLVRPAADDLFRYGSRDVVRERRAVRRLEFEPDDAAAVGRAIEIALAVPENVVGCALRMQADVVPVTVEVAIPGASGPPAGPDLLRAGAVVGQFLVALAAEGLDAVWQPDADAGAASGGLGTVIAGHGGPRA